MSATIEIDLDLVRFSAYDANGFLSVQCDAFGESQSGVPGFEAIGPYGFMGRPLDPQLDESGEILFGAHLLKLKEGPEWFGIPLYEPRLVPGLPQLRKGESAQYGPASNFVRCHDDGRISTMCTSDGTDQGAVIVSETGPTGFVMRGPWGVLTHDGNGLHYRHISGARLDMGAVSGIPSPLDRLNAYASLKAPIVVIAGSAVKIGIGTFDAAAKATPVVAALTSQGTENSGLATALTALAAALTALGAQPTNTPASPACAAAATALASAASQCAAAASAIAAAITVIPAQSVTIG